MLNGSTYAGDSNTLWTFVLLLCYYRKYSPVVCLPVSVAQETIAYLVAWRVFHQESVLPRSVAVNGWTMTPIIEDLSTGKYIKHIYWYTILKKKYFNKRHFRVIFLIDRQSEISINKRHFHGYFSDKSSFTNNYVLIFYTYCIRV